MRNAIIITPSFNFLNSIDRSIDKGFDIKIQTERAVSLLLNIGINTEF
jgi:hypothetical protein